MSDTLPIEKPTTDLTPEDMEKIEKYVADGLPGIHRVDEQLLYRMTDLYLGGSNW